MAKASTTPRKPRARTKPNVPGVAGNARASAGNNSAKMSLAEEQELFTSVRRKWLEVESRQKVIDKQREDVVAEARAGGFTKKMLQIADDLATTRGEAKIKGELTDRLHVARLIGHPMGAQYDLFEAGVAEKNAAGSVDRAYDAGRQQSINNEANKPAGAPGSPEYESHMRGYSEHQTELLGGIKKPGDTEVTAH